MNRISNQTFIYFAYCVNMLSSRMECCVGKSVKRKGLGKLQGYKILFGSYNKLWEGCLPSIVKACEKDIVWGTLWEVEDCLRPKLDSLQGVAAKVYEPFEVDISSLKAKGGTFKALTYRLVKEPNAPELYKGKPRMRFRPSKLYHDEWLEGAEESCLPSYYRKFIRAYPDNGYSGSVKPRLDEEEDPVY